MVKQITWKEFLKEFDPTVYEALTRARLGEGVEGIVMLVCQVLDSSKLGNKTAMVYGPLKTYKSLQMIEDQKAGVYVDGLPSSAAFPEVYTIDLPS